ncbi:MAG: V-type ATP synthase subunit I [Desulfatiglandales bacterium]
MFVKSAIRKVTIAVEKTCGPRVYTRLGRAEIIHLVRLQTGDVFAETGISEEEGRAGDILAGIGFVLNALQVEAGEAAFPEKTRDTDQDAAFVSHAKKIMERLRRLSNRIQVEASVVAEQLECVEALNRIGIDSGAIKKARLLRVVFGQVSEKVPDLRVDDPFVLAGTGCYVLGASLPQAVPRMLDVLKGYGFLEKTGEISGLSLENLKKRKATLKLRLDVLESYTDGVRKEMGPALKQLYHAYRGYEEILKAMRNSLFSEKAMFITGWMDAKDKERLIAILRESCGERFIFHEERDPNAPVRMMNSRLFKPFELIVRTMGMPANSEIDPTPLAALTFVLVFGLMFGDLGQGLVLALAGLILKCMAKKKAQEQLGQAGGILIACGLWAAFCGILYGSLFSSEHLIPALWIHPAGNIMHLFSVTVLLGAIVIAVGLCVNIINAFINADYQEAIMGKRGVAILILYGAVVFMAVRYINDQQSAALWETGAFIVLPLVVFSLRGILGPILFQVARPHDMAEYVTETVMEIVEIALGMFANTVSFIRVGAFALSHAGLSIVTYTLAGLADPSLKSPAAVAVLVCGNIFIIGFEGLICGIQSMRLEYYEFFSKFYKGDGVAFSPFGLKAKISEV